MGAGPRVELAGNRGQPRSWRVPDEATWSKYAGDFLYNHARGSGENAMTHSPITRWASGDAYEPYVGRWSRLVAREFLTWLDAPGGLDWLDVGCGTGALTEAVAERCAPRHLVGIDPS